MSQRLPDNPFFNLNFHPSQLTEQMFSYEPQHAQRPVEMEHQYGDQFQDFIDAIKASNYHVFTQLLRSHPEFATRIDLNSKQTAIFYIVPLSNEDLALQMARDVIAQGADPAYQDPLQQNVMSYIARDGRNKLFDFLTSLGVPVDEVDIYKQTPLFYASREGRVDLCKKILELGANPNHADMNGQTCLFYGAKNGHFEVCKMLVEYGVRHEHVDANKQTALAWAKVSKNQPLIDYLQTLKASLKPQKEKPIAEPKEPKPLPKRRGPHKEKEDPKNFYKIVFLSHSGGRADVSEDEFEKFKQMYPDVADLLLHPEKIPVMDEKPPQEKKKAKWEKVAKKLMSILWKIKGSNIFYEPVDPVKLGCFDYFQIIKQPMDFGTIKNRLITGYYKKIQEFIDDVHLVFKNCVHYNGTGSDVGKVGVFIEGEFNRFCKEYGVDQFYTDDNLKTETRTEHSDYGNLQDFAQSFMDEDFGAPDMFNLSETGN